MVSFELNIFSDTSLNDGGIYFGYQTPYEANLVENCDNLIIVFPCTVSSDEMLGKKKVYLSDVCSHLISCYWSKNQQTWFESQGSHGQNNLKLIVMSKAKLEYKQNSMTMTKA